jgi:hypothetical protein
LANISFLVKMSAENDRVTALLREMNNARTTADDSDEVVLDYYLDNEVLRETITRLWGKPDVAYQEGEPVAGLIQELDWMDYAGVSHAEEYRRRRSRRGWLRSELENSQVVTDRVRNVMQRVFNAIDQQEEAAARQIQQTISQEALDSNAEQIEEYYMNADNDDTRWTLIMMMLFSGWSERTPSDFGRLITNAHRGHSFVDVIEAVRSTRYGDFRDALRIWDGAQGAIERSFPREEPQVWRDVHNALVNVQAEADDLLQVDRSAIVEQSQMIHLYTDPESVGMNHEQRAALWSRAVTVGSRFTDPGEDAEVMAAVLDMQAFNETYRPSYDDEPLQPLREEWRGRVEEILQNMADAWALGEANELFSQDPRWAPARFFPFSNPGQRRSAFYPTLHGSEMRNWDPRLLEALHLLMEWVDREGDSPNPYRTTYTIPELLAGLDASIRQRVDVLRDTRNYLIYDDVRNALDKIIVDLNGHDGNDWRRDLTYLGRRFYSTTERWDGEVSPSPVRMNEEDEEVRQDEDIGGQQVDDEEEQQVEEEEQQVEEEEQQVEEEEQQVEEEEQQVEEEEQQVEEEEEREEEEDQALPPRVPRVRRTQLQLLMEQAGAYAVPDLGPRVTRNRGQPADGRYANSQAPKHREKRGRKRRREN